ncbi:hypothetical protein RB195_005109 [Necator americanus]|uniref:SCP domain-containing protein n=1 Tax=Necator americanus TaxID=51031 RepID=A0ABR1BPH1_NECAM
MNFYIVVVSAFFGAIGIAGQNTLCPQNQVINDTLRILAVKRHNQIRSRVAGGRFFSSSQVYARQASKMIRLSYGCDAEASAHRAAQSCSTSNSGTTTAEARYAYQGVDVIYETALRTAIANWRDEINTGRLPQRSTETNIYQTNLGIPNLAMMIWDTHVYVGCSIVRCTTFTNVVCHYTPAGGAPGSQIYKPGPSCRRCSSIGMSTCAGGLCSP